MKKLWDSPEVVAAILTVIGTLLVSIILGFLEGRIGFGSLVALFAFLLLAVLLYVLYRKAGRWIALGAGVAMVLIGFLVFFGYRIVKEYVLTPVSQRPLRSTLEVAVPTATQMTGKLAKSTATPAEESPAAPDATATVSVELSTVSPTHTTEAPGEGGGYIVGVWETVDTLPQDVLSLCACPGDAPDLYAGATGAIYRSTDLGASWTAVSQGLPNQDVIALACVAGDQPDGPPRMYAALSWPVPVLISEDQGVTWTNPGTVELSVSGFYHRFYPAPTDSNQLFFLGWATDLLLTPNGGQTWFPATNGLPQTEHGAVSVLSLAIDPTDARRIYAGTGAWVGGGRGVYASTDGGQNWLPANSSMLDLRITALAIDPGNPQTVYAGSADGHLLKSIDGGASWTRLTEALAVRRYSEPRQIREIAVDPVDANLVILLGDNSGPMASRDGGQSWQLLGKPGGNDQPYFSTTLLIPAPHLVILADIDHDVVWRYAQVAD